MNQNIIDAIDREREYQIKKYDHRQRPISSYILLMQDELNREVVGAWNKESTERVLEELLQVITLGVACLEEHGIVERTTNSIKKLANEHNLSIV